MIPSLPRLRIPPAPARSASIFAESNRQRANGLEGAIWQAQRALREEYKIPLEADSPVLDAIDNYRRLMEGHLRSLERTSRNLLASDALTNGQRTTLLTSLYGQAGRQRDTHLLTKKEGELIDLHRRVSAQDKILLRSFLRRLAVPAGGDVSESNEAPATTAAMLPQQGGVR